MGWEELLLKWFESYGLKGKIAAGALVLVFLIILLANFLNSIDAIAGYFNPSEMNNSFHIADNEIPEGTPPNLTLAHIPNPSESLQFYMNGMLLREGQDNDYTISNKSITILYPGVSDEDQFTAYYRYK